jgi:transcriptional regulator with XRE-family HTH domain
MNKFAERLKELRKLHKVTQKQISTETAIAERVYQSYEYGKVIPTATTLVTLADYFDVSLDYLVGRSDIKERR